jgi:hypothetical protein
MRLLASIAVATTLGVLAFGGTSSAAVKRLTATDGPGFWRVTLKHGTYRFVCDPHATIMKGVLRVT